MDTGFAERLRTSLADRYTIEREIGRGGMATVYLAQDVRHDRTVAIKVLHPELSAVLGAERFLQEIRVTARLAHPHILPLLDSGEAASFLYYVAPYVEGLRAQGFDDDDLARIRSPLGLDLGGREPGQIAVSIAAGLVADANGRDGGWLDRT